MRGLDLVKVVFGISDLVVIVLLLAIRPQLVLDSLPRHDRKYIWYVAPKLIKLQ